MNSHNQIASILGALTILTICLIGYSSVDNTPEPIKERKQIVIIKSLGVDHVYEVDNRTVRVEYEDAE